MFVSCLCVLFYQTNKQSWIELDWNGWVLSTGSHIEKLFQSSSPFFFEFFRVSLYVILQLRMQNQQPTAQWSSEYVSKYLPEKRPLKSATAWLKMGQTTTQCILIVNIVNNKRMHEGNSVLTIHFLVRVVDKNSRKQKHGKSFETATIPAHYTNWKNGKQANERTHIQSHSN